MIRELVRHAVPCACVRRRLPSDSIAENPLTTGGGKLDYIATAGTLNLYGHNGELSADQVSI